jgi:hypothetical protein
MALARHCASGLVSLAVPTHAKPASVRRQQERLLANGRLSPQRAMQQMARRLLSNFSGSKLLLILDETPKANDLRVLKLSMAYHKREIVLMSICYRPDHPPRPMPKLVGELLRRAGRLLKHSSAQVTLLADRGLCWPVVLDLCQSLSWHWVLRAQHSTRLRRADQSICPLGELLQQAGDQWIGSGEVFKKAGWRKVNVVAYWPPQAKESWLLISDHNPSLNLCRSYCKRTWCEESHRDQKSSGLQWQQSRVNDPAHAARLLLLMSLAMLLAIMLGYQVIKRGWRKDLDPHRRRRLSFFQLGERWLIQCVHRQIQLCLCLSLPP